MTKTLLDALRAIGSEPEKSKPPKSSTQKIKPKGSSKKFYGLGKLLNTCGRVEETMCLDRTRGPPPSPLEERPLMIVETDEESIGSSQPAAPTEQT